MPPTASLAPALTADDISDDEFTLDLRVSSPLPRWP